MTFLFWGVAAGGAVGASWILARPLIGRGRLVPSLLLVLIPLLALSAYLALGTPTQNDAPLAQRLDQPMTTLPLSALVVKIEQRLKSTPEDARGWQMLALLRQQQGAYDLAVLAWQNVLRWGDETADIWLAIAENMMMQNDGVFDERAQNALARAAQLEPDHQMLRYYQGLDLAQRGDRLAARAQWQALLKDLASDDPLRKLIVQRITETDD